LCQAGYAASGTARAGVSMSRARNACTFFYGAGFGHHVVVRLFRDTRSRHPSVARPKARRPRSRRPSRCWPCKSNSVRLGSSSRALTRVGGLRAFSRGSGRRASKTTLLLWGVVRVLPPCKRQTLPMVAAEPPSAGSRLSAMPLGLSAGRYESGALCGQRLDGSPALFVTGLITCSVGRGSEKSVFDAQKRQRERHASLLMSRSLF
jgi:hypothetical protein